MQPLIIEYTNLLHRCGGSDHPKAQAFRREHKEDAVFQRRAEIVDKLFAVKGAITETDKIEVIDG